ncbi:hypothetical protein JWG44_05630 [Leptospira sp. 201903071]|uniref:hypothetical protein n=1 Tax=Leptospira ainazelensis TaxID=2810034 RepID=UPI0019634876|nr:hypothetical protein [Leptospira ainazelensis]MBM9499730.1 hypothetical protein [Leptospira ainazelensis]
MNLYQVRLRNEEPCDSNCELIFAKLPLRAKRLYWKRFQDWRYSKNDEIIELAIVPPEESKEIFKIIGECDLTIRGGILNKEYERLAPTLRSMGWMYEDESSCDTCGLYPFGMEEHWIDEDGQCDECRDPIQEKETEKNTEDQEVSE